ncbi:hypothetical protein HN873_001188 [Arachis hypogaea]
MAFDGARLEVRRSSARSLTARPSSGSSARPSPQSSPPPEAEPLPPASPPFPSPYAAVLPLSLLLPQPPHRLRSTTSPCSLSLPSYSASAYALTTTLSPRTMTSPWVGVGSLVIAISDKAEIFSMCCF